MIRPSLLTITGLALTACTAASELPSAPTPAVATSSDAARGRQFAESSCARCHAIGAADASPRPDAPPLRTLHRRYPIDSLEEAFAEGIQVGHPDMPQFVLEPRQIRDLLVYLRSIDPCGKPGADAEAMKACFKD